MKTSAYTGLIAVFLPARAVIRCYVDPRVKKLIGEIIKSEDSKPTERGAIPDVALTVRGKSGKEMTISLVENYVEVFRSWADAERSVMS